MTKDDKREKETETPGLLTAQGETVSWRSEN